MCSESMSPRSMKWTLSGQKANARVQDPLHPPCPHFLTTESGQRPDNAVDDGLGLGLGLGAELHEMRHYGH